jgi:hypothetical protein
MKTWQSILLVMAVTGLLMGGCKKETSQPPADQQIRQEAESPKEEAPKAESPAEEPKKEEKAESPMQPESES